MYHVLKTWHEELERTHDLIEKYKPSGLIEWVYALFWKSFKRCFFEYAQKKEEILIEYTSLHSDIQKDIQKSMALPTDVEHVRETILKITNDIELCGNLLEVMIDHAHGKDEMIHHEKVFFVSLLSSFNNDLLSWVWSHEKEVFWDSLNPESDGWHISLEEWKKMLLKQKQRLENHMKNVWTNEA